VHGVRVKTRHRRAIILYGELCIFSAWLEILRRI